MKMSYTYKYPRPAVTVDCLVVRKEPELQLLLIQRKCPPFENEWALPGGFVEMDEDLIEAAKRELKEETGIDGIDLFQLQTFGKPGRDPRGRTISIVFWGKYVDKKITIAGDDAKDSKWFTISELPKLAFDHDDILKLGFEIIPDLKNHF